MGGGAKRYVGLPPKLLAGGGGGGVLAPLSFYGYVPVYFAMLILCIALLEWSGMAGLS